jgi:hypothetical protein
MRKLIVALAACALLPAAAGAQDFGVLESAETINRGNFKLRASPLVTFGENGAEDEFGVSVLAGYGFTDEFDAEAGVALYDGLTFIGANAELWIVKNAPVDVSISGGLHFLRADTGPDATGFDLTILASTHLNPRLELFGALDAAFDSFDDIDFTRKTWHIVPGIEYRLSDNLDFLGEVGVAVSDDGRSYVAFGLAYYIR